MDKIKMDGTEKLIMRVALKNVINKVDNDPKNAELVNALGNLLQGIAAYNQSVEK